MDFLINTIVTIAIILYVLQRVREVAKKGGEITGPPPPSPMFEEEEEETFERESSPEKPSPEATRMPRRIEVPMMPNVRPEPAVPAEPAPRPHRYHVPPENAPARGRRIAEAVLEEGDEGFFEALDTISTQVKRTAPPARPAQKHTPVRRRGKEAGASPALTFSGSSVIQGIIMSEILGPPVSMRREAQR